MTKQARAKIASDHSIENIRTFHPSGRSGFAAGDRCRRDVRNRSVDLGIRPRHNTFILLDGALGMNAGEGINGLVTNGTALALGVGDGGVVMPGVHVVKHNFSARCKRGQK